MIAPLQRTLPFLNRSCVQVNATLSRWVTRPWSSPSRVLTTRHTTRGHQHIKMPVPPALHITQTSKEPTQLEEDVFRVYPGGHNRSHHKYVPQPPDTCRRTPYQGNGSQPTPSAPETWLLCTLTATPIPQLQQPSTSHRTSVPRQLPTLATWPHYFCHRELY